MLLALSLLVSGCAGGWSLGAGPTVDTDGQVGFLVTGRVGLGLGGGRTGVIVGLEGGLGPALDAPLGAGYGASVLDVFRLERDVMWRIGLRSGWMGRFDSAGAEHLVVAGGAVAVLGYYDESRSYGNRKLGGESRRASAFGGELRVLAGIPVDEVNPPVRTIFALGFLWEFASIVRVF